MGFWTERLLDRLSLSGADEVVKGLSLSRKALHRQDLLITMGSSELTFQDDFHPVRLFAARETGFTLHLIGGSYRQSIHNFLVLSGLGHDLAGKRLVLFVSPTWFKGPIAHTAYLKNFSLHQAYEFAFASPLSPALKQQGAQRLQALGSPATDDPVLKAALEALARGDRLRYRLLWPVGRLAVEAQRLRDDLNVLVLVYGKGVKKPPLSPHAKGMDWDRLLALADAEAKSGSSGNPFGMDDGFYRNHVAPKLEKAKGSEVGESWLRSSEYEDLRLVLETLKEMKAEPLFISVPILGSYSDFKGHPASDRQAYYRNVKELIETAGFPVVDYSAGEYEAGFMRDPWHQGWKGSVYIAQTMDQFYHKRLPPAGR